MAADSPFAREPVLAEQPTPDADLGIRVVRVRTRDPAGSRIPPDQAGYAIMTCGVLGSVITGTAGMVLTLRIAPGLPGLALAELIFAIMAVFVIAIGRRSRETTGHEAARGRQLTTAGTGQAQPANEEEGAASS